ncbi:acetyl-CoA acetyltransferase [Parahaliea aestuarii]|uniref:Acetyl-CoA acetyltransferase n=1 Tax=Parahaliea aestuarii TaxID=1852021 RepID=A0A5C9A0J6_9GAMM|nr:acetyl-CoA acetyltransferase [Parahaliea aestuarii]TXS93300.1 acetyl-CoA acetyltransferase [Parahaliea aestuarii]
MSDNRPVLIGVAQQTWRDKDPSRSLVDALAEVSGAALLDTGVSGVSAAVDTVVTVPFLAALVPGLAELLPANTGDALCQRLGLTAQTFSAHVGGNTPQQMVNHFANRLARGESRAVLISGGELIATLSEALKSGADVSHWKAGGAVEPTWLGDNRRPASKVEQAHGLFEPVNTYPLFESALRHARGWSQPEHLAVLGQLISRMSEVAAANPHAWRRQAWTAQEAISTANRNRMISYPYTKVMNAILAVDMATAVVMTTAGVARELGVAPEQMIYLRGGADGNDIWNVTERPVLHESPAIRACAGSALAQAGLSIEDMALFDIYSCFPSAVQVACDALGIAVDDPRGVTLTGGLTLFGGPGNNYSSHGIVEMVQQLRSGRGEHGMVTANGNYLTKHSVGIYSRQPGDEVWSEAGCRNLQPELDRLDKVVVDEAPSGRGTIEAFTASYQNDAPARGIVVGRMEDGRRFVANTAAEPAVLERLVCEDLVGVGGQVRHTAEGNLFSF